MAKNTGEGGRRGAVRNRFQLHDPKSDRWAIFSFAGDLLRTKKSPGKGKGIRIGVPKSRRR